MSTRRTSYEEIRMDPSRRCRWCTPEDRPGEACAGDAPCFNCRQAFAAAKQHPYTEERAAAFREEIGAIVRQILGPVVVAT